MILTGFIALLYAMCHIMFVRAVGQGQLCFIPTHTDRQHNPMQYALAYALCVCIISAMLLQLISSCMNLVLLPHHFKNNLNVASTLQLTPLHSERPMITAHRGLAWQYPENTLISFKAAIQHQPDYVELDFRTTSDGHLVCIHDATLKRYLNGSHPELADKPIETLTLAQIQDIDFGAWKSKTFTNTPVATLKEVIALFNTLDSSTKRPILMLEHKSGMVGQLLDKLSAFTDPSQYVIQSFDWMFLHQLHMKNPDIRLAAIGENVMQPDIVDKVKSIGCFAVHWNDQITAENVKLLHDNGIEAWCYTFNHPRQWDYAKRLGLDAITTDRCDELTAFLRGQ